MKSIIRETLYQWRDYWGLFPLYVLLSVIVVRLGADVFGYPIRFVPLGSLLFMVVHLLGGTWFCLKFFPPSEDDLAKRDQEWPRDRA